MPKSDQSIPVSTLFPAQSDSALRAGAPPDPRIVPAIDVPGASETSDPNDPRSDGSETSDPGRISGFWGSGIISEL